MAKRKTKIIKKKEASKEEKQIRTAVIAMVVILAMIFIFYFIAMEAKKFEYAGLKFTKIKPGGIVFYSTQFPIKDIEDKTIGNFPYYFRENPRNLKNMKIDGLINLKGNIALAAKGGLTCGDNVLSSTSLVLFLSRAGINKIFLATMNKTESSEKNITLADCNSNDYSTIIFQEGNESIIKKESNCYFLDVANCEIMNVTERFILGVYAHSRGIEI